MCFPYITLVMRNVLSHDVVDYRVLFHSRQVFKELPVCETDNLALLVHHRENISFHSHHFLKSPLMNPPISFRQKHITYPRNAANRNPIKLISSPCIPLSSSLRPSGVESSCCVLHSHPPASRAEIDKFRTLSSLWVS